MSMLQDGNWILPVNNGDEIAFKPPMLHWLVAAFSWLLGDISEFTSRLPSALGATGIVLATYGFFSRRNDATAGIIAAIITLTCFEMHRAAMTCRVDLLLAAFMVGALMAGHHWAKHGARRLPWLMILLLAGAALTKGPVGVVLPCAVVALYMQTYFPNVPIPSYLYPVALPTTVVTLVAVVCWLLRVLLQGGWVLYHLGVRRGEEMPYATLFDGFGFIGKLILLNIVITLYVFLWSMLFVFPGIIAYYRYSFALYNLYEDPEMDIMEALNLSKRQTQGYKMELFKLDLSYMGWILLSILPSLFFTGQALLSRGISGMDPSTVLAVPMSLWQILTASAFVYALSIFYLPNYQCVQLAYFDAAKEDMPEFRSRQSDFSDGPGSF